jgi:membrane-associated phospholipid phosphatase
MSLAEKQKIKNPKDFFSDIESHIRIYLDNARQRAFAPDIMRRSSILSLLSVFVFLLQVPIFLLVGFLVNWKAILTLAGTSCIIFILSRFISKRYSEPVLATFIAGFGQFTICSVGIMMFSYPAVALGFPFQDNILSNIDIAIGLDWMKYMEMITGNNNILFYASYTYVALDKQVLIIPIIASLALRFREFQTFTIAWLGAATFTIIISAFAPALAAFHHYGVVEQMRMVMMVPSGYIHLDQIASARSSIAFDPYKQIAGIVAFPSFHAAGGVMLAWFFWQIKLLRWPMLLVNVCMIAVTPVIGSHHFIDVFAGIIVGFCALALAKRITVDPAKRVNSASVS